MFFNRNGSLLLATISSLSLPPIEASGESDRPPAGQAAIPVLEASKSSAQGKRFSTESSPLWQSKDFFGVRQFGGQISGLAESKDGNILAWGKLQLEGKFEYGVAVLDRRSGSALGHKIAKLITEKPDSHLIGCFEIEGGLILATVGSDSSGRPFVRIRKWQSIYGDDAPPALQVEIDPGNILVDSSGVADLSCESILQGDSIFIISSQGRLEIDAKKLTVTHSASLSQPVRRDFWVMSASGYSLWIARSANTPGLVAAAPKSSATSFIGMDHAGGGVVRDVVSANDGHICVSFVDKEKSGVFISRYSIFDSKWTRTIRVGDVSSSFDVQLVGPRAYVFPLKAGVSNVSVANFDDGSIRDVMRIDSDIARRIISLPGGSVCYLTPKNESLGGPNESLEFCLLSPSSIDPVFGTLSLPVSQIVGAEKLSRVLQFFPVGSQGLLIAGQDFDTKTSVRAFRIK